VFPPFVLVKKPAPPEMSGVSCAAPFPVAQRIAAVQIMIGANRPVLCRFEFDPRCCIEIKLLTQSGGCVSKRYDVCQLIVTGALDLDVMP
jgi:hypothetical protein